MQDYPYNLIPEPPPGYRCPTCDGTGCIEPELPGFEPCPDCDGEGYLTPEEDDEIPF